MHYDQMTKTRAPLHKKLTTQEGAGMELVHGSSGSEVPGMGSSVKVEYVENTADDAGRRVIPTAADFSHSLADTFTSAGKLVVILMNSNGLLLVMYEMQKEVTDGL